MSKPTISLPLRAALLAVLLVVLTGSRPSAALAPTDAPPTAPTADAATHHVYLPGLARDYMRLSVNPQDRQASLDFFQQVYLSSEAIPAEWHGAHSTCEEGTTSAAFVKAIRLRINYFRAMAGVPADVGLSIEFSQKAQKTALLMSVNRRLSHTPDDSWTCYCADGAEGAGCSNLYLGVYSCAAISGYMRDPGANNYPVGHRRWILYPQTRMMGTGDVPQVDGYPASNALWVFDDNMWAPRPATREEFVAWPPPGYVPAQVVYPRWSFSYPHADFDSATVAMTRGSASVPLVVQPVVYGYGENTLVWEPEIDLTQRPEADTTYTVTVQGVVIQGSPRDFHYTVTLFDADPQRAAATEAAPHGWLGPPPRLP